MAKKINYFQDIYNIFAPSNSFLLEYSLLILIGVFFSFIFFKTVYKSSLKWDKFCRLLLDLLILQENFSKKFNAFTLFVAWFFLFNYLIRTLLQNNIKTSHVIVNTEDLITDKLALLNTKKELW